MGNGINKEKEVIVKQNLKFDKLNILLQEFENDLNELEKEEFDSFEKFDTLELKNKIEKRENDINDELVNLRQNVKQITNFNELNRNEIELNKIANRSQDLYSRKSEIIKNKIKPCN
jgi:hypothetical protein